VCEGVEFSPSVRAEFQYFETGSGIIRRRIGFSRSRSRAPRTRGVTYQRIRHADVFNGIPALSFIKGCSFTYTRSVLLQETAIPYEGEGPGAFHEEYGINRAFGGIAGAGFDMVKYPPWHFFMGRGNFANGRDFAYDRLNRKIVFPGGDEADNYTNSLKLVDSYSLNTTMDFERVMVTGGCNLSQVSERKAVEGCLSRVETLSANTNIISTYADISFRFSGPMFRHPVSRGDFFHRVRYGSTCITYNIEENVHTRRPV
jgi:hypothetical protein